MSKNIALIFAGGVGKRMSNLAVPKQFLLLHGKPIIIHTIEKFETTKAIDGIVVVCLDSWIDNLKVMLSKFNIAKVVSIVPQGDNGQGSIRNGLEEINRVYGSDETIVLIHDGVRPLIDSDLIMRNIESVKHYGTAISASKVNETVVLRNGNLVEEVINRDKSWMAKAPQSFYLKDILCCHRQAVKNNKFDYIDSASLMGAYGYSLHIVECSNDNIKITTPTDYYIFRAITEKEENEQLL